MGYIEGPLLFLAFDSNLCTWQTNARCRKDSVEDISIIFTITMFLKCMLLVSACIVISAYERQRNSALLDTLIDRIRSYQRQDPQSDYKDSRRSYFNNGNMRGQFSRSRDPKNDYHSENIFNDRRSYLADLLNRNVLKDERWNGKSDDYGIDRRSKLPLIVHEDEDETGDIVDENLNDLEEEHPYVKDRITNNVEESYKKIPYNKNHYLEKEHIEKNTVEPVTETHTIQMPNVSPQSMDTYLCYGYKLPADDRYIVEFTPLAKMQVAHHMLLFGCEEPFKKDTYWNCREMQPVCATGSQSIMYAWAKNAPSLKMPENVGFRVGKHSTVKYLVLQVHYMDVSAFQAGHTDHSGLKFELTRLKKQFLAGIYLLANGWTPIPPHVKNAHIDMGCQYPNGSPVIYPFRFRTHAHKLGVVITGYRVRNGKWTLIGKGDPQRPQAFYKVFNDIDIQDGDKVMGRCTYNSMTRNKTTYIGATHSDEMCNFYIMYFYDSQKYKNAVFGCNRPDIENTIYPKDTDIPLAVDEANNRKTSISNEKHSYTSYEQVHRWPKHGLTDGDLPLTIGQISGVAVDDARDLVFIFHRGRRVWGGDTFDVRNNIRKKYRTPIRERTIIWINRKTGDLIGAGGERMFCMPHGITLDSEGNIWVTDVGAHQVFKLSPKLKILLSVGVRFENGKDDKHFCKPTDVAVMKDGTFFVADGYCNSRIAKFDKDGKMTMEISESSFENTYGFPKPHNMNVVHSLALDEKHHRLFVADRENRRVLIFHPDTGEFKSAIVKKFKGAVYAVAYNDAMGGVLHVVNGPWNGFPLPISGFTYSLTQEKIISKWKPEKGLHLPHDVAVTEDNRDIFVAEIGPNKIWKFTQVIKNRP
ncbi:peptidyl-glycine alpha-amidating monooxygenase-like [Hydractinia symbiolongicarpus]|uniref:peptidyl-glycine alpha-amidating monooxygenase-like n=1 Tax=Hydractinia symbiolongicarpus TaxID=13093 RepID=UPI00254ACB2A|nr:peptidyl-glycine alpha-amidating monooxygenase-like [Hydractinia symbiolongicarpus]